MTVTAFVHCSPGSNLLSHSIPLASIVLADICLPEPYSRPNETCRVVSNNSWVWFRSREFCSANSGAINLILLWVEHECSVLVTFVVAFIIILQLFFISFDFLNKKKGFYVCLWCLKKWRISLQSLSRFSFSFSVLTLKQKNLNY